jgi:hypothetical protein
MYVLSPLTDFQLNFQRVFSKPLNVELTPFLKLVSLNYMSAANMQLHVTGRERSVLPSIFIVACVFFHASATHRID